MRNLETNGAKRPMPEVAGSNPAPGTKKSLYPENNLRNSPIYHVENGKQFKTLEQLKRMAKEAFHNNYQDFLRYYEDYLLNTKKLNPKVVYECVRMVKKFIEPLPTVNFEDSKLKQRIAEFLDITIRSIN